MFNAIPKATNHKKTLCATQRAIANATCCIRV